MRISPKRLSPKNEEKFKMFIVNNLPIRYHKETFIKPLFFSVHAGSIFSIMGPNGSGKTTLLRILCQLEEKSQGTWGWRYGNHRDLKDTELVPLSRYDIGYVPQRFMGDRAFPLSVLETLTLSTSDDFFPHPIASEKINDVIDLFGLQTIQNHPIACLSGGQFQRLMMARVHLSPPPLILLDEPFAGMDHGGIDLFLAVIEQWKISGSMILLSHHNRARALELSEYGMILGGKEALIGPVQEILSDTNWHKVHSQPYLDFCC